LIKVKRRLFNKRKIIVELNLNVVKILDWKVFIMKKNKLLNSVSNNFHSYKISWTMGLLSLSAEFSLLGNVYGMVYSVLAFLPIFAWGILLTNENKNTDL
jgi:hypothetical protein